MKTGKLTVVITTPTTEEIYEKLEDEIKTLLQSHGLQGRIEDDATGNTTVTEEIKPCCYLTRDQLMDWAQDQPDDAVFCEHCLSRLVQTEDGLWYCPNEMCLYEEQGVLTEQE